MCSIGEDDFGDTGGQHSMPENENTPDNSDNVVEICKKCGIGPVVDLNLKAKKLCKNCFFQYVHHKFRAALGSTKVLPRDTKVLIFVDGRTSSIVLLDMIRFALRQDQFRKLQFYPKILYLDESIITGETETTSNALEIIKEYDFETYITKLSSNPEIIPVDQDIEIGKHMKNDDNFLRKYSNIKTTTSKQDFLEKSRRSIFKKCALKLECPLIFVPEIATDLSKNLLTDISLGRGASVAYSVAFIDDRNKDVRIVRPIRDLTEQEVKAYISLSNLNVLDTKIIDNTLGESIQSLTADFVNNLQTNYTSTVSTVFRTGDKLAVKSEPSEDTPKCKLCLGTLDFGKSDSVFATEFSRILSSNLIDNQNSSNFVYNKTEQLIENDDKTLCNACKNIVNDSSGALDFILEFE